MYAEVRITDYDGAHVSGKRVSVTIGEETILSNRITDAEWLEYKLPLSVSRRLLSEADTIGVAIDSRPFADRGRWIGESRKQSDGSYLGDPPALVMLTELGVLAPKHERRNDD